MTILGTVGGTPLVELTRIVPPGCARVLVKDEGRNPTGSMKDRMARSVVERAAADGRLGPQVPLDRPPCHAGSMTCSRDP
ncbi:MAG: pyridoxal-phosphate dependent enzyme [Planctomycetota bacterium]